MEPESVEPGSRGEWRSWLAANGDRDRGIWLIIRKGRGAPLPYPEAVEEALAAGWIDSKANRVDAARFKVWMAPRRRGSVWSPINKERVSRLTKTGSMTPRGLAVVERAKADGSWSALDEVMSLEIPADLREALDADPTAADYFERFPPSSKRIILEWIRQTKNPETRRRRIEETVDSAARNMRVHHSRQPKSGSVASLDGAAGAADAGENPDV